MQEKGNVKMRKYEMIWVKILLMKVKSKFISIGILYCDHLVFYYNVFKLTFANKRK